MVYKYDLEKIKGGEDRREFANIVYDILEDLSDVESYSNHDEEKIRLLKDKAGNHFPMGSLVIAWTLFNKPDSIGFQNKRILMYLQSEAYEAYRNIINN